MNELVNLVSVASVLCALFAAVLWVLSATLNLPMTISPFGTIADLHSYFSAMKRVARLNAGAAVFAFASAATQALSLYLSVH